MKSKKLSESEEVKDEDISRSLLTIVAANSLQIANMHAEMEKLSTIVMIGSQFDAPEFMQMCSVN